MEYKVIHSQSIFSVKKSIENLTRSVMEHITLGWEPLGGVSVSEHGLVAQAMIKRRS